MTAFIRVALVQWGPQRVTLLQPILNKTSTKISKVMTVVVRVASVSQQSPIAVTVKAAQQAPAWNLKNLVERIEERDRFCGTADELVLMYISFKYISSK